MLAEFVFYFYYILVVSKDNLFSTKNKKIIYFLLTFKIIAWRAFQFPTKSMYDMI